MKEDGHEQQDLKAIDTCKPFHTSLLDLTAKEGDKERYSVLCIMLVAEELGRAVAVSGVFSPTGAGESSRGNTNRGNRTECL